MEADGNSDMRTPMEIRNLHRRPHNLASLHALRAYIPTYEALGNLGQDQWLQRHPEAGSSWSSWPKAS